MFSGSHRLQGVTSLPSHQRGSPASASSALLAKLERSPLWLSDVWIAPLVSALSPLLAPLLPTPAAKVDHDVSFSIMGPRKPQWSHVTPDSEGTSEGIVHCLGVQIRGVANDPGGGRSARECVWVCKGT